MALIAVLWLVGGSALVLAGAVSQRSHLRRKVWLGAILIASALYAFGYGLELAGDTVSWVFATYYFQHLAIVAAPVLIVLAAADVGRQPRLASRPLVAVMSAVSLLTLALVYTNPLHDLYHANPRMVASGPLTVIEFDAGLWYKVFHVYLGAALLTANFVLFNAWSRAPRQSVHRGQVASVALATLLPWLGSLVYLSGALPLAIDTSPLALAFTSFFVYLGVTRFALADATPIARELVFERMEDPVLVLDTQGRVLDANAAASRLPGLAGDDWRDRLLTDVLGHQLQPTPRDRSPRETMYDVPPIELGGRTYDPRVGNLSDRRGRALGRVVVLRDVTEQADVQKLLVHLATTDELTGLANRRHFLELAERMVARAIHDAEAISLIVYDLDDFKAVNDSFGHQTGDAVLRTVARVARACLRPTDLLGRYGGEEFAACLPNTDSHAAKLVAERLRAAVDQTRTVRDGVPSEVTASVGACTLEAGTSARLDTLLGRADAAQYEAKRLGGDRVVSVVIPTG